MRKDIILIITFVWLGFIALIAQTIALRELLVVFFGNELCLGIIFTAWLLGITLGAFIASFITDRIKSSVSILIAILLLITIILPFQIYLIRISRLMLDIPLGQHIPFSQTLYMSFLLVVPFSILIGIAFPVACKIYAEKNDSAQSIGNVYVWEALGSLLAGILFTFWLVERFTAFEIILISNGITLLLAITLIPKTIVRLASIALIIGYVIIALKFTASFENQSIQKRWEVTYGKEIQLVKSTNSKYGNIAMGELQNQYSLVENGKYVSSFPDEYTHAPLAHLLMTQHPKPNNVVLIGGGIEGTIKEMLKYPIESLDYIQLDPKIIKTVKEYLPAEDRKPLETDKRLRIHYADGRQFIKYNYTSTLYDLIIISLPDPSTATINRFYTTDFFKEAKQCLSKSGVLVTRCSSAVNYFGEDVGNYTGSVYDSLASVFKQVLVTPGTEAYFFATDAPDTITFDIKTLDNRYCASGVESKYFVSPASFEIMLPESQIKLTQEALAKRKTHYLNTDLKPITYFFNLVLWDTMTDQSGTFFKTLAGIKFWWIIGAILFIAAIWFGMSFLRKQESRQRTNALLSMFIIGLSGLSLELILLLAFQNIYGYLYQYIGFMIALFMAGLALGAIISNRLLRQKTSILHRYWMIHIAITLLSLGLVYLMALLEITLPVFFISSFIIISGTLTGMAYPILSKTYIQSSVHPVRKTCSNDENYKCHSQNDMNEFSNGASVGQTAGMIDAFDHLGACLGALFTGVLLIPLFGIAQTCLLIALLNLLTMIFIVSSSRSSYNTQS
ncbi:MAG: fused MFS/spermidine synthase [Planctomycetes bacterium]|nr:fused MFS/spermidine synthase [Planctomycetota bacterium]